MGWMYSNWSFFRSHQGLRAAATEYGLRVFRLRMLAVKKLPEAAARGLLCAERRPAGGL
jgi:hypothetical protein